MVSKKFVLFAVSSMFVAGATLASNVSFGQRAARWVSENMDFMGPISGLVHAVVRSPDFNRQNPVMSYQVQGDNNGSSSVRAGQPTEFAAYRGNYGSVGSGVSNYGESAGSQGSATAAERQAANAMLAGGSGTRFQSIVGDNNSALNRLAKDFLRKGSLGDEKDLWNILNGKDGLKLVGDMSAFAVGTPASGKPNAAGDAEIPMILAAVTSGDSLVSSSSVVGAATDMPIQAQSVVSTTTTTGKVPLPGGLALLGIGLLAGVFAQRRK